MTARSKRHGKHMWKTAPLFGGRARQRARRWVAVTALTPALLLPVTLVGASSSFLAAPQVPPGQRSDPRELGVTGHLPQAQQPGPDLLGQAGDPRELAGGAERPIDLPTGPLGIPATVLAAYHQAAEAANRRSPGCGLHWSVLASIGRIESGHARSGSVDLLGTTVRAILGPRLSGGPGIAAIQDTDGGALDGDPVWDRAVGPMQFIPSTWRKFAVDGNADGAASPHNVHDATAAAGQYLCSGGGDLRAPSGLASAVFRYNHSESYVRTVLIWAAAYANGVTPTPSELAPEVDDVLAGERLPDGPAVLAMPAEPAAAPPAPSSEPPAPSSAPPTPSGEVPSQPGAPVAQAGEISVAPPTIPEPTPPNLTPSPSAPPPTGTSAPQPTTPGTRPPASTPPPATTPGAPPPASTAPPATELGAPQSSGTGAPPEPGTPPPATEPGAPQSDAKPVPPPTAPPAPETAPTTPGAPPSDVAPPPPSVTEPLPETGDPAPPPVESLGACDPAVLGRGEFVAELPAPGTSIAPGTTDPATLVPGQEVYVQHGPGAFATCTTGIPTPPQ
ncbi:Membrane-bound lytic murein transglycosylase B [Saccharopolyspora antimicrobica]|uniref:Membrane-bound lytic murein transglycosylase B n=2 Tax=Saccharopolyspora antimicrobica TaxID=455193 RepID=A0A1I5ES36_9PSEU|nr:membrane-bound lytic murein transglycosylase B [Saccharopolyspora antimicrobica]SFO14173.1 Membrane-bound lytic murein transglycosylase B [Saccharopolyspora antimicrobica]